jgi:hypothetical protein
MTAEQDIKQRIQARIGQGEFLATLLQVASHQSSDVQQDFVQKLAALAATMRTLLTENGFISSIAYHPREYWPALRGKVFAFVDGGVANLDIPSAAPIGIRVGTYIVKPGQETDDREQFNIALSLVDDLYSENGHLFDADFLDIAKLRDTARITSEIAAAYHLAKATKPPDAILLHGPLVNPVAPYGLDDFPSFGTHACRTFLDNEAWTGDDTKRQFVALYLELLEQLRATGVPVAGAVERSIGREPVMVRHLLEGLVDARKLPRDDSKRILDDVRLYGLNDASVFDVVLQGGEYVRPTAINRQGPESKWPDRWKQWIRSYPPPLTTYLKPAELVMPFRIEAFDNIQGFESLLSLILYTSRLLPSYGFPVGLDIVDKFSKVPAWMSRGIRGQHQVVLLQKALASNDPAAISFAKRVLASRGRDWFFRPQA